MGRVELGSNPEHPHKKAVAVGTPLTPALRLGKGDRNRSLKGDSGMARHLSPCLASIDGHTLTGTHMHTYTHICIHTHI